MIVTIQSCRHRRINRKVLGGAKGGQATIGLGLWKLCLNKLLNRVEELCIIIDF